MDFYNVQSSQEKMPTEFEINLLEDNGLSILFALMDSPATVKQLSLRFNTNRAKIQFKVDSFTRQGLVYVYDEVRSGNRAETYYAATKENFTLPTDAKSLQLSIVSVAQLIIDSLRTNLVLRSKEAEAAPVALKFVKSKIMKEDFAKFANQVNKLATDFNDLDSESGEEEFTLVLGLYQVLKQNV